MAQPRVKKKVNIKVNSSCCCYDCIRTKRKRVYLQLYLFVLVVFILILHVNIHRFKSKNDEYRYAESPLVLFNTKTTEKPIFNNTKMHIKGFISSLKDTFVQQIATYNFLVENNRSQPSVIEFRFHHDVVYQNMSKVSEKFRNSHKMQISGNGRLGNKMFQLASLIGVCAMHGYKPVIFHGNSLLRVFNINIETIGNSKLTNTEVYSEQFGAGIYDKKIEKLNLNKNATLNGYFQSWKYFAHVEDDVRKAFTFSGGIRNKVKERLAKLNIGDRPTVGVHIRRGDMNTGRELQRGYNIASKEYLLRAVEHFRTKYKNPVFYVVSDDMRWSRQTLIGDEFHFLSTRNPNEDLAILSMAQHSVVTSGSFGWWGAFLAGGEVVYFNNFPKKGSWLDKIYNRKDYYPPHWIPME